ncbi:hypothetical protein NP88_6798 [Burkholderia cepacia]|uniref:hypothetical protein n=1 Tax=Burkholderia cenocepacia TaxID=95486 RepID=UPI000326B6B7|nr:hypothetical protein [Burkholderia cenocepacia]KIS48772.1 hypothetical protein NP88_6798 [Burkholderia cepacia]
MPRYQKFLFFAQRVYHRLPLQQQMKWRIRRVILPVLLSLRQENPSIGRALKAAFVQPPMLRDGVRELRLQNLLLDLARRGVKNVRDGFIKTGRPAEGYSSRSGSNRV